MQVRTILACLTTMLVASPTALASPLLLSRSDNETATLLARQGGYDTSCEIGDGNVYAIDENGPPAAYTILWDAVDSELCTQQGCYSNRQKCVLASANSEVCIRAEGDFLSYMRNDFIYGARHIFDRTVQRTYGDGGGGKYDPGTIETGTNLVDLNAIAGSYSGFGIRVELFVQSAGGGQCPNTLSVISEGGSLLPGVGAVFGLVGFLCNNAPTDLALRATG